MDRLLQAQDLERWSEPNIEFHRAVAQLTRMRLLIEFTRRALDAWMRLRRWYVQRISVQMPQSQAEHRQMIELLARRETAQLACVVVAHNQRMRESYQQAIHQMLEQPGRPPRED